MTIVLDASSAVSLSLYPDNPTSIFEKESIQKADKIISVDLLIPEVTNAFWKYCTHKIIGLTDAAKYGKFALSLVDQIIATESLWYEALELGVKNSNSTYDCFYLALAKRSNATLLTRDKKLKKLAIAENIKVIQEIK